MHGDMVNEAQVWSLPLPIPHNDRKTNLLPTPDSEQRRQRIAGSLRAQLRAIETPTERIWEMVVGIPSLLSAIKTCLDLNLFQEWALMSQKDGSCVRMNYQELSKLVDVDSDLLRRLLRHLASNGIIEEVADETYVQSGLSRGLCNSSLAAGVLYHHAVCGSLYLQLSNYLQASAYRAPRNPRNGLFQKHKRCTKTVFELYESAGHEKERQVFGDFLAAYRNNRIPWTDLYPTLNILTGYSEGPLLVDVGGNLGEDLEHFSERHPNHESSLFLLDLPGVTDVATCDARIRRIPHDFFEPHPIKGSRAYYMHSILHDWNDEDAVVILKQIKNAMTPGCSMLLVNDIIIPRSGATPLETAVDMQMMIMVSGFERTEDMFRDIFERAGLQLDSIWRQSTSVTSIAQLSVRV